MILVTTMHEIYKLYVLIDIDNNCMKL